MQHHNGWTCEELFNNLNFNILTRIAVGIDNIDDIPFCPATFFNFQNRLSTYYRNTGNNLLEKVFDGLTQSQIQELGLKTNICRTDSFQAMSNITKYSRLQLLIEVIIRLYRVLTNEDKERFCEILKPYMKSESHRYLYNLGKDDLPVELEKIAVVYHELYKGLKKEYHEAHIFKIFERVYQEHFRISGVQIEIKGTEELHSGCLQSPDDIDATYRKKKGKEYKGQVVNVCETANPENPINLINDVTVENNNVDDSVILNNRIDTIKEKTPDLDELHTDGGYGSEGNDKKLETLEIDQVTTGVRGRNREVAIQIEQIEEGKYKATCEGGQTALSEKARNREKACFANKQCKNCPLADKCPTLKQKLGRVYYFKKEDYLKNKRNRKIKEIPLERRKIRANVEATMKEFTKAFNHKGKLPYRGCFRTMLYAVAAAIGINFGRIYRYKTAFS